MSDRFSYVAYDQERINTQAYFKEMFAEIEKKVLTLKPGRAQSLVLNKLEEAYMWIGKAIRDEQIAANGYAPEQPGRNNE